jgi:hypothetical protein
VRFTALPHSLFGMTAGTKNRNSHMVTKTRTGNPEYDARTITTNFSGTIFKTAILYWFTSIKAAQVQTDNRRTNKTKTRIRP